MTDKERIDRLEQMVKTLAETCQRLVSAVNTGSYEYDLSSVNATLNKVESWSYSKE